MALDPVLLEIIICPACGSPVADAGDELECTGCDLAYPVVDGTPLMLVDRARSRGKG